MRGRAPGRELTVGAALPLTGRYAIQGAQARAGLELWAAWAGAHLELQDDASRPDATVARYAELLDRCDLVVGPYGSDATRAVARASFVTPLWNHGGAADDVQQLPGVVSLPSPASGYLVALARAVARERPGCTAAIAFGRGAFARLAVGGLEQQAASLPLVLGATVPLELAEEAVAAARPDAVLLCGTPGEEIPRLRALRRELPSALLAGVSPGLRAFPDLLGEDPDGMLAPAQWHSDISILPDLGPRTGEILALAASRGLDPPDYVAAQAFASALVAARCRERSPDDPLATARSLRATTFFGAFALDPETGLQRGHRLCVVRWRGARQELVAIDAP